MATARPLSQIEDEIRALSTPAKEALLRLLWAELDGSPASGVDSLWLDEATRRDREIDDGTVETIPAEDVFRDLDARLRR